MAQHHNSSLNKSSGPARSPPGASPGTSGGPGRPPRAPQDPGQGRFGALNNSKIPANLSTSTQGAAKKVPGPAGFDPGAGPAAWAPTGQEPGGTRWKPSFSIENDKSEPPRESRGATGKARSGKSSRKDSKKPYVSVGETMTSGTKIRGRDRLGRKGLIRESGVGSRQVTYG